MTILPKKDTDESWFFSLNIHPKYFSVSDPYQPVIIIYEKKNESAFATFGNLRFCMSVISHPAYSNNCVYHYGFDVKIPPNYILFFRCRCISSQCTIKYFGLKY